MSTLLPPLAELALSRTLLDRAAHRRDDPALVQDLLRDPSTAVVVVHGAHAVVPADAPDRLAVLEPGHASAVAAGLSGPVPAGPVRDAIVPVFLGEGPDGRPWLALLVPTRQAAGITTQVDQPLLEPGLVLAGLRDLGEVLDAVEVAVATAAVALGAWHAAHPHCSACGAPTAPDAAGWTRRCPACGRSHFPRTDPAVIMAVQDGEGRLLLGRQRAWLPQRYSTLAGFVEPGESLETAVRREVAEECGVLVTDVAYQGSQPWPFPCSLMLGFSATAATTEIQVDGVELEHAGWWTREGLREDVEAGRLSLPPGLSIARRLIEQWYGGPIPTSGDVWR